VILLSGGLDSATTLAWAIEHGHAVHALTVRYGQRHEIEIERAREIARDLGAVEHRVVDLDLTFVGGSALTDRSIEVPKSRAETALGDGIPVTYVPARNLLFLSLALAWAEVLDATDLFVGVNALDYSGYPDCRPEFLAAFERVAALATRQGIERRPPRIRAPLIDLSKAQIVLEALRLGLDPGRTISCYDPSEAGAACRQCDACLLRAKGFREAGVTDPAI